jgi:tRNA(adenine34) deaminase
VTGAELTGYGASFEPAMRLALEEAALAAAGADAAAGALAAAGTDADVPVGAVVLDSSGEVVARAHNQREASSDPTAHAEILALREAGRVAGSWRLTGHTLVVTLEPCAMCAGAVTAARLGRLVYGTDDAKGGAVGSLCDVVRDPRLPHQPEVIRGVLADAAAGLLRDFFAARRARQEPG